MKKAADLDIFVMSENFRKLGIFLDFSIFFDFSIFLDFCIFLLRSYKKTRKIYFVIWKKISDYDGIFFKNNENITKPPDKFL
jgi:hypothetical protein